MSDEPWRSEVGRVAALRALHILDTPPEERFDRITRLAAQMFDMPIALVTLVDLERQWFKSCIGLDYRETPRSDSFCSYAIRQDDLLEIPNARKHPLFAANPSVAGPPHITFYAGQPLTAPSGHRIGTLCVLDRRPRTLTPVQREQLRSLAAWVELECTLVQANAVAAETAKAKQDFVALVGDELRTPLTSVHASLELLGTGRFGALPDEAARVVGIAGQNAAGMVRLADDVLDLSRIRSGRLWLNVEDIDLADVVKQALHAVVADADRLGVPVSSDCGHVMVRGDADRLVQAITNLVANAVTASTAGSPVTVAAEAGDVTVAVRVADHGPGIPADQLDRVFEPFVQVDTWSAQHDGAGLGLAIARGIVETHGGTLTAESTHGVGSTFTVVLPVAEPSVDRPWW